jgi:hypothetical protein
MEESWGTEFKIVAVVVVLNGELEPTLAVIVAGLRLGICEGAVYTAFISPVDAIVPTSRLPF